MKDTIPIYFCEGYKYQLREDVWIKTDILPPTDIITELVELYADGRLLVKRFFAWDGCSGPAIDTLTNARAGLGHDALYFLMRMGLLDQKWRPNADALLERLMIEDGDEPNRAAAYRWAVSQFAEAAASPKSARKLITAPGDLV